MPRHGAPEQRKAQAEAIRRWQPWTKATAPRAQAGKAKVSLNAYKGGHREYLRALSRQVTAELWAAREMVRQLRKTEGFEPSPLWSRIR